MAFSWMMPWDRSRRQACCIGKTPRPWLLAGSQCWGGLPNTGGADILVLLEVVWPQSPQLQVHEIKIGTPEVSDPPPPTPAFRRLIHSGPCSRRSGRGPSMGRYTRLTAFPGRCCLCPAAQGPMGEERGA